MDPLLIPWIGVIAVAWITSSIVMFFEVRSGIDGDDRQIRTGDIARVVLAPFVLTFCFFVGIVFLILGGIFMAFFGNTFFGEEDESSV